MAKEYKLSELDKMAKMAEEKGISYGKLQQKETLELLRSHEHVRKMNHQYEIARGWK